MQHFQNREEIVLRGDSLGRNSGAIKLLSNNPVPHMEREGEAANKNTEFDTAVLRSPA